MDELTIGDVLKDFRSIKLPADKRAFIDSARKQLQESGDLPLGIKVKIRKLAKHYSVQFEELYAARERARKSQWRIRSGVTLSQAEKMVQERREKQAALKNDVGF